MDSIQNIKSLIKSREDESLEFKLRINNEAIGRIICSFLNGKGGNLLIGVNDDKRIVGITNPEAQLNILKGYLSKSIVPEAPIDFLVEMVDNKPILIVKVWPGANKPYIFQSTIYFRRGSNTIKATSQEVSELLHDRETADLHWERRTIPSFTMKDFDIMAIKETIRLSAENERGKIFRADDVEDFLSYYGLTQSGYFTNAAVVLFAKEPVRFIPQSRLRVAVLKDSKTGSGFISDRYFEGHLYKNTAEIEQLLNDRLKFGKKFHEFKWERNKGFQYPMDALSEGVLNAMVHRDYSASISLTTILIYPNRLEITNTGQLPPELSAGDLKRSHLSYPKNPDIAHIFFLRGYIDKIGRGTLKIMEACKQAELPQPRWETSDSMVKLTFYADVKSTRNAEGFGEGISGE